MSLLQAMLEDVRRTFSDDKIKAGVVLSELFSFETYASIARYGDNGVKMVVVSAKGHDLDAALSALAVVWIAHKKNVDGLRYRVGLNKPKFDRLLERTIRGIR